jgi:hypothetical protein
MRREIITTFIYTEISNRKPNRYVKGPSICTRGLAKVLCMHSHIYSCGIGLNTNKMTLMGNWIDSAKVSLKQVMGEAKIRISLMRTKWTATKITIEIKSY